MRPLTPPDMRAQDVGQEPIVIRGLRQGYRGRAVIRGLDLTIRRGVTGLLGPNGAGKTTLLKTVATATPPRAGTVTLLGRDVGDPQQLREIRRRLGFLPQQFGYFPNFTVEEFVEYSAWLRMVPRRSIARQVTDALTMVDLIDARQTKMRRLSGGMLRRAGVAQAVVNDPELLILDEPTAGLDPQQRVQLRALIRRCGERGAVLVATHLVEDVAAVCGEVLVMLDGRFAFHGIPEELAALGGARQDDGDTPLERGYSSALRARREAGG